MKHSYTATADKWGKKLPEGIYEEIEAESRGLVRDIIKNKLIEENGFDKDEVEMFIKKFVFIEKL